MTGQPLQFENRFTGLKPPAPVDPRHKELVKQTQKWVSQTFFGTLLKQMRNSPFKSELFSGGRGGQAFNEMFDQQLADHMARGSGSKLVKAIVRKTEAVAAYRAQTARQGAVTGRGGVTPPSSPKNTGNPTIKRGGQ